MGHVDNAYSAIVVASNMDYSSINMYGPSQDINGSIYAMGHKFS